MTFNIDWQLLDASVSDALRDFLNERLERECRQRLADLATAAATGAGGAGAVGAVTPAAAARVTRLWWGTEAPLLEILEIEQAPPHAHASSVTASATKRADGHASMPAPSGSDSCMMSRSASSSTLGGGASLNSPFAPPSSAAASGSPTTATTHQQGGAGQHRGAGTPPAKRSSDRRASAAAAAGSGRCGPASLLEAVLGEAGLQMRVHLVHGGGAGFELAMDLQLQVPLGGDVVVGARLPMTVEVSNWHVDVVLVVTVRVGEVTVAVEPDRFGSDGADALLSSLSVVVKIGDGAASTGGATGAQTAICVDRECARTLALKELRAILARTIMLRGVSFPMPGGAPTATASSASCGSRAASAASSEYSRP